MSSAFNIPAGFALVPLELTDKMRIEWEFQASQTRDRRHLWKTILAVVPPVDAVPGEPVAPMEWTARRSVDGLRIIIDSADFEHDASLILTGDFATEGEKLSLAGAIADKLNSLAASVASRAGSEPVRVSMAKDVGYDGVTLIPFTAADDGSRWLHIRHPAGDTNVPIRQHRDGLLWDRLKAMADAPTAPIAPAAAAEPSSDAAKLAMIEHPFTMNIGAKIVEEHYPDRERAASLVANEGWTIIAPDGWKFTGEKPMNLILEASRHEREIDPVEADRQDMRLMAAIDEEMAEHKRDRAELVNRFLRWPLPKTVFTDAGTGTVEPSKRPENWSASGTNLLTAEEATAMLAFVLDCDEGDRELAQREVDRASAGEAQS